MDEMAILIKRISKKIGFKTIRHWKKKTRREREVDQENAIAKTIKDTIHTHTVYEPRQASRNMNKYDKNERVQW